MRLSSGKHQLDIELGSLIGEGRDGRVYDVIKKEKVRRNDLVLKILFDPTVGNHVNRLLSPIRGLVSRVASLSCLPREIFVSDDGKYCLLMKKAEGEDLEKISYDISNLLPYNRLKISYQITEGIRILHDSHIIHSDIAHANIVIDTKTIRAFIIDIDGGGRLIPYIVPRVQGRPDFMAPEFWDYNTKKPNRNVIPNLFSDNWSLATLLHYILTGGLFPFFFVDTIYQIITYPGSWPPSAKNFPAHKDNIEYLSNELDRLGNLSHLFMRTFNEGRKNPSARPSSVEWAECLKQCGLLWAVCKRNGCENYMDSRVAKQPQICVICGRSLKVIGKLNDFNNTGISEENKKQIWLVLQELFKKSQDFLRNLFPLRIKIPKDFSVKTKQLIKKIKPSPSQLIVGSLVSLSIFFLLISSHKRNLSNQRPKVKQTSKEVSKATPPSSGKNELKAIYEVQGNQAYEKGNYQEALKWYKKALDIDPDNTALANKKTDCELMLYEQQRK